MRCNFGLPRLYRWGEKEKLSVILADLVPGSYSPDELIFVPCRKDELVPGTAPDDVVIVPWCSGGGMFVICRAGDLHITPYKNIDLVLLACTLKDLEVSEDGKLKKGYPSIPLNDRNNRCDECLNGCKLGKIR